MMLPIHVSIALFSVVYTAFVYFSPTRTKLKVSYGLVALTIATGTWLVVSNPAHMVQACLSGLLYLGVTFLGIALAYTKLRASED